MKDSHRLCMGLLVRAVQGWEEVGTGASAGYGSYLCLILSDCGLLIKLQINLGCKIF